MIKSMKVENMNSPRSDRPVANQYIITTEEGEYFQSYRTMIAFIDLSGYITLDADNWDYSATTLKYLKEFLKTNISKKEIQRNIDSGVYKTANLN